MKLSGELLVFVRSYIYQARVALSLGQNFFSLIPKLHWVHETSFLLKWQARVSSHCINPAVYACQMDEDFIGRCAALSRCVSPRLVSLRVFQRYLAHIQICWARS